MRSKVVLVCAAFIFLYTTNAYSVGYGGIGGRPAFSDPSNPKTASWFIYNLEPGTLKQDAVEIINNSVETVDVLVYPQESIKSSDGGFALKQFGDTRSGIGEWIRLYEEVPESLATTTVDIINLCGLEDEVVFFENSKEISEWCQGKETIELTLPPESSMLVPFVISIPESVDTGEHTGGILIQKKEADQNAGSGISISTRVGVRVYQTVPGEIFKQLSITNFIFEEDEKNDQFKISISLKNTGNASVDSTILLHFKDPLFRGNSQTVERIVQVLREDESTTNYEIPRPKIGILKLTPVVTYIDGAGETKEITLEPINIWVVPWIPVTLIGLGLVLVIVASFILFRLRSKKYSTISWVEYKVRKGDSIADLAVKLGVQWKLLAKANKLAAPYVLELNQVIKLPAKLSLKVKAADAIKKRSKKPAKERKINPKRKN